MSLVPQCGWDAQSERRCTSFLSRLLLEQAKTMTERDIYILKKKFRDENFHTKIDCLDALKSITFTTLYLSLYSMNDAETIRLNIMSLTPFSPPMR